MKIDNRLLTPNQTARAKRNLEVKQKYLELVQNHPGSKRTAIYYKLKDEFDLSIGTIINILKDFIKEVN